MTEISSSSLDAQSALLDKLGIRTVNGTKDQTAPAKELGQDEFLKLMTTQLQNQDPFEPMDNGDFIAQMAQFSSVTGIRDLGKQLEEIAGQMAQFRIATAANMLGNSVLVPGSTARADSAGEIHGVLDLPRASVDTRITYSDAETGEVLKTDDLGGQASGLVGFSWTDLPEKYADGSRAVKIEVSVNTGEGPENLQPNVFAKVMGAAFNDENGVMLDVRDQGEIAAEDVLRFRL